MSNVSDQTLLLQKEVEAVLTLVRGGTRESGWTWELYEEDDHYLLVGNEMKRRLQIRWPIPIELSPFGLAYVVLDIQRKVYNVVMDSLQDK